MRRSIREAIVGFSLLAAAAGGMGFWLWLRGISLSRSVWRVEASFSDAAGLAVRSPVTYRGVLVGNVRQLRVTDQAVVAELDIRDARLRLARPVVARVGSSSVLGGDAEVALISGGAGLPTTLPGPRERGCDDRRIVCNGGRIQGVAAASLSGVTDSVQQLLAQAEKGQLVPKLVAATSNFQQTARDAGQLTRDARVISQDIRNFVRKADGLAQRLDQAVDRTDPILANLNVASADAARTSAHLRKLAAALDNPRTVQDLKATMANARDLTARWEAVGGDVQKLSGDPRFLQGLRSVSIGLGRFFEELYPAATGGPPKAQASGGRARPPERPTLPAAPRSRAPATPLP